MSQIILQSGELLMAGMYLLTALTLDNLNTTIGLSGLTTAEVNQLKNIGLTTISTTQWGYLGNLNQDLTTASNVTFNNVTGTLQTASQPKYYFSRKFNITRCHK